MGIEETVMGSKDGLSRRAFLTGAAACGLVAATAAATGCSPKSTATSAASHHGSGFVAPKAPEFFQRSGHNTTFFHTETAGRVVGHGFRTMGCHHHGDTRLPVHAEQSMQEIALGNRV